MGLLLLAVCAFLGALVTLAAVLDLWSSLALGCLGVRPALRHFHQTCSSLGDLVIALGTHLKDFRLSFPLSSRYGSPVDRP
jgi:hypothetical protein